MTRDATIFQNYTLYYGNYTFHIADGSLSKVARTGSIVVSKDLNFVLLVPNLDCSFLSISKLTQEKNYVTKIFLNHCFSRFEFEEDD